MFKSKTNFRYCNDPDGHCFRTDRPFRFNGLEHMGRNNDDGPLDHLLALVGYLRVCLYRSGGRGKGIDAWNRCDLVLRHSLDPHYKHSVR